MDQRKDWEMLRDKLHECQAIAKDLQRPNFGPETQDGIEFALAHVSARLSLEEPHGS